MKRVRRARTGPEEIVARLLRDLGVHYRRTVRTLPGSPDFANRRRRWVIFVNGCFWHHHTACPLATVPAHNRDFWVAKFRDNRRRDARKIRQLRRAGFRTCVVWQCETRDTERLRERLRRFLRVEDQAEGSGSGPSSHSTGGSLRAS